MTEKDYDAFVLEFRRFSSALVRYRQSPEDAKAKADAYFHALKKFPLAEVNAKADRWLEKETKFPAPAEWAGVIVTRGTDVPTMTDREARDHRAAEGLCYEGEPCSCALCIQAGVSEKPIRFVPEFDRDDKDRKVLDPLLNRVVTAGHWAHGNELARYYEARANFWNRVYELGLIKLVQGIPA